MSVPEITVQTALGNNPGDASPTWRTIHDGAAASAGAVRAISYQRGRQNELNRVETGQGSVVLKDPKSYFDPRNTASPHYPNVKPRKPIRAYAVIGGTTYYLFSHYTRDWARTQRVTNSYTERVVSTRDGFSLLANAGLAGLSYVSQLSGARVTAVLNDALWSSTARVIGTGQATLAASSFTADDTINALEHLQQVAESENGLLYIDGQGRVVFVERTSLISAPYTVSQATFHDATSGGAGYSYVELVPNYSPDLIVNEWRGTRTGGTTQVATDTASETAYGPSLQQFTSLVTADTDVLAQAQFKLRQFKDPLNRVESITVMPGTSTSAWQAVLGLDVGSRITVAETPPGFTVVQSADYLIQNLSVIIPAGPVQQARFTFGLWPADTAIWFILDDPVAGKLDTGVLAY